MHGVRRDGSTTFDEWYCVQQRGAKNTVWSTSIVIPSYLCANIIKQTDERITGERATNSERVRAAGIQRDVTCAVQVLRVVGVAIKRKGSAHERCAGGRW
jgi:hypothetical protein